MDITLTLLQVHATYHEGNDKIAKAVYRELKDDVRGRIGGWTEPGYSRPRIVLILLAENILDDSLDPSLLAIDEEEK
jgi:hypothetical protein